ncbi:NmrA family NAD(P)-binding protein [Archangium gephyra]|uniref:NmrA family NAD(P)-binding protein n=1 Tax=Archangium gephyra TaxID=48 RepID=UPI0023EA783E|nr:NmrA family NAD(P)-binding protein [Archangium gephyra]
MTGQVGGAVARTLLSARQQVRAVVRDASKGAAWKERGCELALADIRDAGALTAAFKGTEGVFVILPPLFDPTPGFPEVREMATALRMALEAARVPKIVCLSTIGAQARQSNLLSQLGILERMLWEVSMPITFLRPAWFMENSVWDVAPARERGVVPSFLQPLDKPVPMVATEDIGRVATGLLQERWEGRRIVELEGPRRVSPNELAATFTRLLGRPVRMEAVPRETWAALFSSQGMKHPLPRTQMLDGFNEGWIEFERGEAGSLKGTVPLETVLKELVARA